MRLTDEERAELLELSRSQSLRDDMARVAATRHNPFLDENGEVDADKVVDFLTQYNEFSESRQEAAPAIHRKEHEAMNP